MKTTFLLSAIGITSLMLFLTGCGGTHDGPGAAGANAEAAALAQLSPEDQTLAHAQGYCAVTGEPLGSMGAPIKLILNDQPVFVCCGGCASKAKSHPDETLAKVEEFKAKVKAESSN